MNHDNSDVTISDNNKSNKLKNKYTTITVEDPFNNRYVILILCKRQKGVYIWESIDGKNLYVGHSINLYNRISSYFMPSILNTKARRVLKYLNKHGLDNIILKINIMDENSSLEDVVNLEQYFIEKLKPNINVDLVASSSGYN